MLNVRIPERLKDVLTIYLLCLFCIEFTPKVNLRIFVLDVHIFFALLFLITLFFVT